MISEVAQEAVSAALNGKWEAAREINKKILKDNSRDVEALNRLARAYAELGDLTRARATSKKVIKVDPFNSIATKALEKWRGLKSGDTLKSGPSAPQLFLEEQGKTKIVSLLHLGDTNVLKKLDAGDEVKLSPHKHRVSVTTQDGKYIGRLPDDLSARIRRLIKYGNRYQVLVKSNRGSDVKVFIRETKKAKALADIPSFSTERIDYISFTRPELVHAKEKIISEDDEE